MRDVQAQVLGVESSTTRTGKAMYSVNLSSGEKVTTFELPLATKAAQSVGQPSTARIEDVQRGDSTYHNLKGLFLAGEQIAPIAAAPGTPVAFGAPAPAAGLITPAAPRTGGGGGMSAEDKVRVTKLSCISSACALFSGSGDIEAALEAAQTIFQGVMQPAQATQEAAPAAVTPEALALVAQQAGAPVQVGTAGVAPAAEPAALPWS